MSDPRAANTGEQPGDVIGRYKLLEQIGEGGMGSVWMAEQREPVKRRVALKVIKLGMDTKQVIARFEAERQALALMDHPHIAKVLDAGATDTGRPYFVMEYIKGVPIVEYCDRERLDTRSRLELFASVCQAIQHAHHKGVVHRDIKPGNVLVTLHDGVPVPKVIDFGIAKATNAELTTKTLFTEHRQMLGTPAYMSPEQAEMSGLDIDTRTDVYSLGVLLYELLTGTTPFDIQKLLASGFAEMMRAIREDEPHRPSTRISSLGDTGTRTAEQRRVELRKLSLLLRGDLDWIVMKCLEKDRTRRYETASGLAADVRRYLFDEPVTATPPSAGYRLRKFARRHRAQAVVACAVFVALVLGVTGTTAGMVWASDEAARAEDEKTKATLAAASEAAANAQAQENERHAVEAARRAEAATQEEATARRRAETISAFVVQALRSSDPEQSGAQATTVLQAMDRAIADIASGRFAGEPAVEADLQNTIGLILRNNGQLREAEALLARALATRRRLAVGDSAELAQVVNNLALVLQETGRAEQAVPLFEESLAIRRRLRPGDDAGVAQALNNLAGALPAEEAEPLVRQALEMYRRLVAGDHEQTALYLNSLADKYLRRGRPAEAEPLLAEALQMIRRVHAGDHPLVAVSLDNLGRARVALRRVSEGTERLREALAMRRRVWKSAHPDLAIGIGNLAGVLLDHQHWAEAEPLCAEALAMHRQLFPGDTSRAVVLLYKLSWARRRMGRTAEAERLGDEAVAMARRIHAGDHLDVAWSLCHLGSAQLAAKRFAEADATQREALSMFRRLQPGDHTILALALQSIAVNLRDAGRAEAAEPLQAEAVEIYRRVHAGDHERVSLALYTLGSIREALGRAADAVPSFEAALAMDRRLLPADHDDVLADLTTLARAYNLSGAFGKATPLFEEASRGYEAKLGRKHRLTLMALGNLGANHQVEGRSAEAVPLLEEARAESTRHPALSYFDPLLRDAYVAVADPAKEGTVARAVAFIDELIAESRSALPDRSPDLASRLAAHSLGLLALQSWDKAEPLLREVLAIRATAQPDVWSTFNAKSLLGDALLGQRKLAEAESLLLDGYRGMKEREATIPPNGAIRIPQALERLVRLYEAKGDADQAAAWRRELDAARSASGAPNGR